MQSYQFDDRNITWRTFDYLGTQYYVQAVDAAMGTVDVLIKFQANTPGKLHQHLMDYSTFVLQGELRFWRPDGSLKEVRSTGSHVHGAAYGEPHTEGAGDQVAIVLYSIRGGTGDMFAGRLFPSPCPGTVKRNIAPWPAPSIRLSCPPWASTMVWQIDSPTPNPSVLVVTKG